MPEANAQVWKKSNTSEFYLIPVDFIFIPAALQIESLDEKVTFVDETILAPFAQSAEAIEVFLKEKMQKELSLLKNSFQTLSTFYTTSGQTDKTIPALEKILHSFPNTSDSKIPPKANIPATLQELFSDEEQQGIVGQVMNRLKGIAQKLDKNIAEEDDNPGAWVEVLYNNLFQDEIAAKKKATAERIEASVNESIANALRENGVKPSVDFE